MDYFGIQWIYLYLCTDILSKNTFVPMHIYLISGQDAILFQWKFIFASSTIKVLIFTGRMIKPPHLYVRSSVSSLFCGPIAHKSFT